MFELVIYDAERREERPPEMPTVNWIKVGKACYVTLAAFFGISVVISLLCPLLEFHRNSLAPTLYLFLRYSCHQIPSRCYWILGSNTGLCSRCFCLYMSFFVASILLCYLKSNVVMKFGKVCLVSFLLIFPLTIDGSIQFITTYHSNCALRSITGCLAGLGLAILSKNILRRRVAP